jgi:hypothetical protein
LDQASNCSVREFRPVPSAIAAFVQHTGNGLFPLMLGEKFVNELSDGCFFRVGQELAVLPMIA